VLQFSTRGRKTIPAQNARISPDETTPPFLSPVDLRGPRRRAVSPPPTIEITAEPNHHLLLENQFVRVFKVVLAPHAAMIVHNHRHDYFFTVLGESHIENDVVGKPPALRTFHDGETFFVPGDFAHTAKNLSDQTFQVVAVELMQNDKAQIEQKKWDEDRGPAHPERRHSRHLFVKDGVAPQDLELQLVESSPNTTTRPPPV